MTIEITRNFFAWCAVINIALLVWWILYFTIIHDWTYRLHSKWFKLSVENFDAIHYAGMALLVMGILLLNLAPYFALRIIG